MGMGLAMTGKVNGRRHVNDSFNQFRFINVWHGFIAPFKFLATEAVTRFQGRHGQQVGPVWGGWGYRCRITHLYALLYNHVRQSIPV
jgi:hypothetical protein